MHAPTLRISPSLRLSALALVALLGACAAPVPTPPPVEPPTVTTAPPLLPPEAPTAAVEPAPEYVSHAVTPRDYRKDGARHIYGKNAHRIFKGKMPPLLQGVGTMQLELDHRGQIVAMNWMRPPSHPMAKAEIERAVREAAPYPAPVRMGRVVYTDTWLWDKSGHFQLDTLTEGQRDR
jgi:periplasmic protein TonB